MANCHECNAEVKSGKKLCEDCAKKKIAEMEEPEEEEMVDSAEEEDMTDTEDEEDGPEEDDSSDCTPQSERVNRIIAAVIDCVFMGVAIGLVSWVIGMLPIVGFLAYYVTLIGSTVFFALRDVLFDSQSPGKKVMGFKVVKIGEENRNIDTMTSVLRNAPILVFSILSTLLSLISIGPLAFLMMIPNVLIGIAALGVTGYELFLVFSTGKRIGDKLGRTKVVKV